MARRAAARARACSWAAALGCSVVWAAAAHADPAAAERYFSEGSTAYKRGQFLAAAEAFEAAFREEPHGAALYNAGLSWQAARHEAQAADAYAAALARGGLDAHDETNARQRLADLESRLGLVEVRGSSRSRVSVAHVRDRPLPTRVHLEPGAHELRCVLPDGSRTTPRARLLAGRTSIVDLRAHEPGRAGTHVARAPDAPEPTAQTGTSPAGPIVGGVALGTGGVLTIAAIVLGLEALDARDEFEASGQTDADAHDDAARLRTWTNVCWVGAGVLGVTGIVVLLATADWGADPDAGSSTARVTLQVGPAGAELRVGF